MLMQRGEGGGRFPSPSTAEGEMRRSSRVGLALVAVAAAAWACSTPSSPGAESASVVDAGTALDARDGDPDQREAASAGDEDGANGRDASAGGDARDGAVGGGGFSIKVVGNHFVDGAGATVQLRGVNRSGAEYACAEGTGIWDGPTDDDASVAAIKSWHINTVRLPMNEDCWLGINGVDARYANKSYQDAITSYVNRLNAHGVYVILNLHFSAPGATLPKDQVEMPDRDHAKDFWTGVATAFKDNHAVLFDLFNEPYPDSNQDTTAAWQCVKSGGTCPGVPFPAAGMQELTDAVRATGATQPLLIAGPQYAGVVDKWSAFAPNDPLGQLVASIHIYGLPLDSPCRQASCWDGSMAPLATTTPIVIGELGDTDCTADFSPSLMTWADAHGVSYAAWAWNVADCAKDPSLLTGYDGTPTPFGAGVRAHLQAFP
jgi:endoglucanase